MPVTRLAPMAVSPVLRLGLAVGFVAGLAGLAACGGGDDDDSRAASALGAAGLQRSGPQQPAPDAAQPQGAASTVQP